MSTDFSNAVPYDFVLPRHSTTSKSVLNKDFMEILPAENSNYNSAGNNVIRFNLSSNTSFLAGPESYIKFELMRKQSTSGKYDGTASLDIGGAKALIKTAELRLVNTGSTIQRVDYHNRYHALKSLISEDKAYVRDMANCYGDSMRAESSMGPDSGAWHEVPGHDFSIDAAGSITAAAAVTAAQRVTAEGTYMRPKVGTSDLTLALEIGDVVRLSPKQFYDYSFKATVTTAGVVTFFPATASTLAHSFKDFATELLVGTPLSFKVGDYHYTGAVSTWTSAISFVVTCAYQGTSFTSVTGTGADTIVTQLRRTDLPLMTTITGITSLTVATTALGGGVAAKGYDLSVFKRHVAVSWRQKVVEVSNSTGLSSSTSYQITVMPDLSFFNHTIPLFLMKGGIELQIELESGVRCMTTGVSQALSTEDIEYGVNNPRFVACMITPHSDVVDEYLRQWRSSEGILYSIPSVRARRVTGSASDQNASFTTNFGLRSANKMYVVCQDSLYADGVTDHTRCNDSLSLFIRGGITEFQAKVGSQNFPLRPVHAKTLSTASGMVSTEAWKMLQLVARSPNMRLSEKDFYGKKAILDSTGAAVSQILEKHFIMAIDLARDNGPNSNLCGSDLAIVPLMFEISRDGTYLSKTGLAGLPVFYIFVEHDSFLKISSDEVAVMN